MDDYQRYLNRVLHFLSFRPRSEKEVRDNLLKKKASSEIIEKIVAWLKENRFLNDEDFAKWWVEQRARFKPRGIRIIKLELRQKGISQEIIDNVISLSAPPGTVLHLASLRASNFQSGMGEDQTPNEIEMAKKIVAQKIGRYKGLDKREMYRKLSAQLARRGFDWDTIKKAIDEVMKD